MKRFLMWLLTPWFLSLLGVAWLSLLLWFAGPLLAFNGYEPFANATARWLTITILMVLWTTFFLWKYSALRWANRKLMKSLSGDQQPDEEIALLNQRMREALAVLRKADTRRGSQYLYQLPWYMFIGAPGSGKTTALVHSGLRFPVADSSESAAVSGVGGTRHCDWWFSEDAVLLDTAGRYTTQDSNTTADQSAWLGFLALLKKHRRRQPINGVIVTISVSDLLQTGATSREVLAQAIRARIQELHAQLGIGFPIYVVVTKCDLLAGFIEFFESLGREERMQVWGMTFPLAPTDALAQTLSAFSHEFAALERQLQVRVLARMQQERDLQRRALLYRFPQQFASVGHVLGEFLNEVFAPTRYEEKNLLRGVYFCSGTQEGFPIDRVMASLAGAFGLDRNVRPRNAASGRSYFLTSLLREVVFKEAGLAGINTGLERGRRRLQHAGFGAVGLLLVLMGAGLFTSYLRNQSYVETVKAHTWQVTALAASLPSEPSLQDWLTLLNTARQLTARYTPERTDIPWLNRLGLSQHDKLQNGAHVLYQRILRETLRPKILGRLEEVLRRGDANNLQYLYATLRVYLMLGDQRYLDPESVLAWLEIDWPQSVASITALQLQQLLSHTSALLRDGDDSAMPPILDTELIAQTRLALAQLPMPQRLYQQLKREVVLANLPEFSVNAAVGRDVSQVLMQHSGTPLTRGVQGLYSVAGWQTLQGLLDPAIADAARDKWVLDRQESAEATTRGALKDAVLQLYYANYIEVWDSFLADIRIVPFSSLGQAARTTAALAEVDSALVTLMQAVARQTTLSEVKEKKSLVQGLDNVMQNRLAAERQKLAATLGSTGDAAKLDTQPTNPVAQHFSALHTLVGMPDATGPAPIDQVLATLKDVSQYFDAADSARRSGAPAPTSAVMSRLKRDAQDQPAPLNNLLQNIDSGGGALTLGNERARLNALWSASAAGFCRQAIAGRYPMALTTTKDITPDDFGKFFGPNGLMDAFFTQNLAPYVDMSGGQWRWRSTDNAPLGIPAEVLKQFQLAARLREMFFSNGGTRPTLHFNLEPLYGDSALSQVKLEIDGQPVAYAANQPSLVVAIILPSGSGDGQVSFDTTPPLSGDYSTGGPWAWFRMMDKGLLHTTAQGERYRLVFTLDGRNMAYQLDANSVINPFRRQELLQFRCPLKL